MRRFLLLTVLIVAIALGGYAWLRSGLGAGGNPGASVEARKPAGPKPAVAGARNLAREYWRLADRSELRKVFGLLRPADRAVIDRETFYHRFHQENEFNVGTTIGRVSLNGDKATVRLTKSMVYDVSSETVSGVQELVFEDGRWYPHIDGRRLIFFGAAPDQAGIVAADLGEEFRLLDFKVKAKRADLLELGDQTYLVVELKVTNSSKKSLLFSRGEHLVLVGPQKSWIGPVENIGGADPVTILAGETIPVRAAFLISEETGYSLLFGRGGSYRLVPIDL